MSLFNRILPWQRSRLQRTWMTGETRAVRDALAANIVGLAQAMEERFVWVIEHIDAAREAQSAETSRAAEAIGERVEGAMNGLRAALDARLDSMATQVAALRDSQEFARVLRELKRDLGAQISLSSFEAAAEIRNLASEIERPVTAILPKAEASIRSAPDAATPSA